MTVVCVLRGVRQFPPLPSASYSGYQNKLDDCARICYVPDLKLR